MREVINLIAQSLASAFPGLPSNRIVVRPTPDSQMGDLGVNTFPIAKALGEPEATIAEKAAEALKQTEHVRSMQGMGTFVNVFVNRQPLVNNLCNAIREDETYGSSATGSGKRALIEHTSINPNASPHVGRGRNALIGDCLARLMRFEKYDVEVHYYVNDIGKQIALLVLECRGKSNITFDDMLALYVAANERAKADPAFEEQG